MPHDAIKLIHHASALAIVVFLALGLVAPRLSNPKLRAALYPVEGMGVFSLALFQIVSGATLAGQRDIPWNTPWVAGAVALLLLALVLWVPALTRRAKGNTTVTSGSGLSIAAIILVLGSYVLMLTKAGGV